MTTMKAGRWTAATSGDCYIVRIQLYYALPVTNFQSRDGFTVLLLSSEEPPHANHSSRLEDARSFICSEHFDGAWHGGARQAFPTFRPTTFHHSSVTKPIEGWNSYDQHRRHLTWEESDCLVSGADGRLATLVCNIASILVQVGTVSLLLP